ncbi:MAG: molybdopterin-dependent oxidoreductase [Ilumatobacteraceae bacterium]
MDISVEPSPTSVPPPPGPERIRSTRSYGRGAIAGLLAAAAALAAGELVTSLDRSRSSLVSAVGNEFIDRFAASLKELAVRLFGTNDKAALVVGIVTTSLLLGAVFGVLDRRFRGVMAVGLILFGVVGAWTYGTDPQGGSGLGLIAAAVAVVAGLLAHRVLDPVRPEAAAKAPIAMSMSSPAPIARPTRAAASRRTFLAKSAAVGAGAAGVAVLARSRRTSGDAVRTARARTVIPRPRVDVEVPAGILDSSVAGISPYVTPNSDFYRIDTALLTPSIDVATWKLAITGMVDEPVSFSYQELLDLSTTSAGVTMMCVSNEIGDDLVGNAVWQGVPLTDLLDRAGVQPGATQIVGRSVDGWTAGFPTEAAYDGRTALVAVAMNGEPLPQAHGFPARLVVAGLYGYVSATKWLDRIELTTWEEFDGYWVPRGWSKEGPIKTASRIDVPRSGAALATGRQVIAGVAWAPNRGISKVEVQVDDGPWEVATLGDVIGADTWVQWMLEWDAPVGSHQITVRATDGDGITQTEERAPVAPDGATGWHSRRVMVS